MSLESIDVENQSLANFAINLKYLISHLNIHFNIDSRQICWILSAAEAIKILSAAV